MMTINHTDQPHALISPVFQTTSTPTLSSTKPSGPKWSGTDHAYLFIIIKAQNITYHMNPRGSVESYAYLLSRETNRSQIVLYSGNWDVVVPYTDTVKNIKSTLRLRESYVYHPWFTGSQYGQHAGFAQLYSGLLFLTVKGASHQVPQSKREAAFQIFKDTLSGHPEFQHLPENMKAQFYKD